MPGGRLNFARRRQDPVQIRYITKKNAEDFLPYLKSAAPYTGTAGSAVAFGLYFHEVPCAAAELRIGEGYIDLYSIKVAEESRTLGLGMRLLERVKEFAAELDIGKIYAQFMLDDKAEEKVMDFLQRNRFYLVETGDPVPVIRPAALINTELFRKIAATGTVKNTVRMNALPHAVSSNLTRQPIPESCLPENAKGRIIGELSPGIVAGDSMGAFVIVTAVDGALCISGAYTDKAHASDFARMTGQMLSDAAEKYPEYDMYVKADCVALFELLEKMSGGEGLKQQTARAMMWSELHENNGRRDALAEEAVQEVADGMEILVPKLMSLMDMLDEEDIQCDLMMGEFPYLMIDESLLVQYTPLEEDFSRFALTFSVLLLSEKTEEELKEDCLQLNRMGVYFTAVLQEQGILLKYSVPEQDAPITEEQFIACVDECMREFSIAALL